MNVVDSIFTDNIGGTIVASGGALANSSSGTLNVINSSIIDNKATASGAGINNGGSGTLNVIGTTNNPPKQKRTLTLSGTYNNGATFSGTWKVTLP